MNEFQRINQDKVTGILHGFDRMIFKGHMTTFFPENGFSSFLNRQGILLKDYKEYVTKVTGEIKKHVNKIAEDKGRPFQYLNSPMTKRNGKSKEDIAKEIAEKDNIKEGLVCIFSTLEMCNSFGVKGNHKTHKKEVARNQTRCLHYYFYIMDKEFGLMHIRLQSWFPLTVQIHINGRRWLEKKFKSSQIKYEMYENSFSFVEDIEKAQALSEELSHFDFPKVFDAMIREINPWFSKIKALGYPGYYWVADQVEIATDVMFKTRGDLEEILPTLFQETLLNCSATDVMKFLGKKMHGNFKGEVTSDIKKRPQGWRVKHYLKRNHIKMYDKGNILRIETTINNPREFKIFKTTQGKNGETAQRWIPLGKSVANLYRHFQIGIQSNNRYLMALGQLQSKSKQIKELDSLCQSKKGTNGKPIAKMNPVDEKTCEIFLAVMTGDFIINGLRNKDLVEKLFNPKEKDEMTKRYRERISRLISKLRGHGLLSKVQKSRLYRVTKKGFSVMSAALRYRNIEFPGNLLELQIALT